MDYNRVNRFMGPYTQFPIPENQEQRNLSSLILHDDPKNIINLHGDHRIPHRIMENVFNYDHLTQNGLTQSINIFVKNINETDLPINRPIADSTVPATGDLYSVCGNSGTSYLEGDMNFYANGSKCGTSEIYWQEQNLHFQANIIAENKPYEQVWNNTTSANNVMAPKIIKPIASIGLRKGLADNIKEAIFDDAVYNHDNEFKNFSIWSNDRQNTSRIPLYSGVFFQNPNYDEEIFKPNINILHHPLFGLPSAPAVQTPMGLPFGISTAMCLRPPPGIPLPGIPLPGIPQPGIASLPGISPLSGLASQFPSIVNLDNTPKVCVLPKVATNSLTIDEFKNFPVDFGAFEKILDIEENCVRNEPNDLVLGIKCCMRLAYLPDNRLHIDNDVPGTVFGEYGLSINSNIMWGLLNKHKMGPRCYHCNNSNLIKFAGYDNFSAYTVPPFPHSVISYAYGMQLCFKIEGYHVSFNKQIVSPNFQTPITAEDVYETLKMKDLCTVSDFSPILHTIKPEESYQDNIKRSKLILWVLSERPIKFQKPYLLAFGFDFNNYRLEYNTFGICAVGSGNGALRFFENDKYRESPSFSDMKNVTSFAWCPNGNIIATVTLCGWLQMSHIGSSSVVQVVQHTAPLLDVKWNTLGTFVACVALDKLILIVDIIGIRCMRFFVAAEILSFDLNAAIMACGDINGFIQMWKIDEHPVKSNHFPGHLTAITKVVWDLTGRLVASSSNDFSVRIWQYGNHHFLQELLHDAKVTDIIWSPKTRFDEFGKPNDTLPLLLATSDTAGNVRVWDVMTANLMWRCLTSNVSVPTFTIAFSPCGEYIAGGSFDQIISEWEVKSGDRVDQALVNFNVCQLAYVPGRDRLVSAVGIKPFQ